MEGYCEHYHEEEHARAKQLLIHGTSEGRGLHKLSPPHSQEGEADAESQESTKDGAEVSGVHHDLHVVNSHTRDCTEEAESIVTVQLSFSVHDSRLSA